MTQNNHDKFLSHLDASSSAVWTVAKMLNGKGYNVSVPAHTRAKTHDEWKQHADGGDIFISQRIEVKQLGIDFTGSTDWPFGSRFIVCAKHAFDRATPRPYAYIILSRAGTHAATVFCSDSESWYVEERADSRYKNVRQEFYFSPIHLVRFFCIPTQLP